MADSRSVMIPIDENYAFEDTDSDSETTSSGQTLASNVTAYRYENGRRYHAFRDGAYYQPNDEQHHNHEMILHHIWFLSLDNNLYAAPLKRPKRILDIGTGVGAWAVDMADRFPDAEVIGVDLSPAQYPAPPTNVTWEVDDVTAEWVQWPEEHFDFIHIRGLVQCIPDWTALYRKCFKHLKPGGFVEHLDHCIGPQHFIVQASSPSIDPAMNPLSRWPDLYLGAAGRSGKTGELDTTIMSNGIQEAGFTDINAKFVPWPIGGWSSDPKLKEIGKWNARSWEAGMEGWVLALLTRQEGWSYEQVQQYLNECRVAMKDKRFLVMHGVSIVYAMKPLSGAVSGQ